MGNYHATMFCSLFGWRGVILIDYTAP